MIILRGLGQSDNFFKKYFFLLQIGKLQSDINGGLRC